MKRFQLLLIGLLALGGCKPEKSGIFFITPEPVFEVKRNPLAVDSINAFRPVLGDADVVRQFPFGLAGKPTGTLRLSEVSKTFGSFPDKTVFQYDILGRLSTSTDYIETDVRLEKRTYQYNGSTSLPNTFTEINGIKIYGYLPPLKDELVPSVSTKYETTNETKSWILKSAEANPSVYSLKPGTTRTRQGFGAAGALVWEEEIYLQAADAIITSYKLYRRDTAGNAVFIRSVGDGYSVFPTEEFLTYDDKLNPYRTTGDIMSLESTNVNNILSRKIVDQKGQVTTYRYEYEYRPDGYPSQMKTYRNGGLLSTNEFGYNQ